jgi:two-component system, cell cycle sensor histidine kinase and response regulator CckA
VLSQRPQPELRRSITPARAGGEIILVVEDEDSVRRVIVGILRRGGYEVHQVPSASCALELVDQRAGKIDLLLTDVVMPGTSGTELARTLSARLPALRVLCMSGYTEHAVFSGGILKANFAFIQKPILPDALLRKVREVLDQKG